MILSGIGHLSAIFKNQGGKVTNLDLSQNWVEDFLVCIKTEKDVTINFTFF